MTQTCDLLEAIPNERPVLAPAAGVTVAGFLAAHGAAACVWLAIWQYAGQASLSAWFDSSWMWRWTLLLAALIPLRFWSAWWQGRLAILVGGLWPAGKGSRDDAELAFSGGLASLVSVVELALASSLLTLGANGSARGGASGGMLAAVFLAWTLLAMAIAWRYARARDRWSISRDPAIHDSGLNAYHGTSARMDRWAVRLNSFGPNGWVLIAVLGLVPAFYGGASPSDLAVGLGGVLLAYQALRSALPGVSNLIGALVSWSEADPLFSVDTLFSADEAPSHAVADNIGARHWRNENRIVTGALAFETAEQAHLASHV